MELDDLECSIGLEEQMLRGVKYWCTFWEGLGSQHFQNKGFPQGGRKEEAASPARPVSPAQRRGTGTEWQMHTTGCLQQVESTE